MFSAVEAAELVVTSATRFVGGWMGGETSETESVEHGEGILAPSCISYRIPVTLYVKLAHQHLQWVPELCTA